MIDVDRGGFPFVDRNAFPTKLPNTPGEVDPIYWEDDNCINMKTRDCLQNFFANATPADALIFVAGLPYCGSGLNGYTKLNRQWLLSSASAFRSHLTATFPGTVFRLNNAHVGKKYAHHQSCIDEVNDFLDALWYTGSERRPWYSIDQRAINVGRDQYYNDALHYVGPLTMASLTQALNMLCPRLGEVDRVHATSFMGSVLRNKANLTEFYVVDSAGQLRAVPSSCTQTFVPYSTTYPNVTIVAGSHIASLLKGPPLPSKLCDKDRLYQLPNDRTVFVLGDDHKLHSFRSGNEFLSRGYSFELVDKIDAWLMMYFRNGGALR